MGIANSPEDRTQGAEPAVGVFLQLSGVLKGAETSLTVDAVRQLLFDWRDEDPEKFVQATGLGREKFYYFAGGPKLTTFGALATCAAALEPDKHWSASSKMKEALSAWMKDSAELGRPAPVACFVAMAEVSRVIDPEDTYSSTTNALKALPLHSAVATALVRYEPVEFERITDGIEMLRNQLGEGSFPGDFEEQWRQIQNAAANPLAAIAERFAELSFDTAFVAEVLEVRAATKTATVSRALKGENIAPVVAPGILEVMANPDSGVLSTHLEEHMQRAFQARRCKGRKAPHASAIIRDVFGIRPEQVGIISKSVVLSLEQESNPSKEVFDGSRAAAERRVSRVLNRLIDTIDSRGVLSKIVPFPEVMSRLKENTTGAPPGIGPARLKAAIKGEFVPPMSAVKTALQVDELPAWLEVDVRLRFADQMVQEGRTPLQRLLVQLATEEHESISAFRKLHDTADNPWSKGSWDKFYGNLGKSVIHNSTHLDRALRGLAPTGVEGGFARVLSEQFQEQINVTGSQDYVGVACSLFSHLGHLRDFVETGLASFKHVLKPSADSGRRVPTMKLGELLQELREAQEYESTPYHSELHERALPILKMLPGISTPELKAVIDSISVEEVAGAIPDEPIDAERVTLLDLLGPGISSVVKAGGIAPELEFAENIGVADEESDGSDLPDNHETDGDSAGCEDASATLPEITDLFNSEVQTIVPGNTAGIGIDAGDEGQPLESDTAEPEVDPVPVAPESVERVLVDTDKGGKPSESAGEEQKSEPVTIVPGSVEGACVDTDAGEESAAEGSGKEQITPPVSTDSGHHSVDPAPSQGICPDRGKGDKETAAHEGVPPEAVADPAINLFLQMVEGTIAEETEIDDPIDEQSSFENELRRGTSAHPGSEWKKLIMMERAARNLPIHLDEDRKQGDERFEDIDLR